MTIAPADGKARKSAPADSEVILSLLVLVLLLVVVVGVVL